MIPLDTLNRLKELLTLEPVIQTPQDGDGVPFVALPAGMIVHSLEHLAPPCRIKRNVVLTDAESFAAYVNQFKSDNTLVFVGSNEKAATFKAIIDYHGNGEPDYCDHVATFSTIETPEWKTWIGANRVKFGQVDFATWLEDNLTLFRSPSGADLLELVQTLEGKSSVRFNSSVRLNTGANRLVYDEDVELKGAVSTQSGNVELPTILTAGIAPFQGGPAYEVQARLKFRIEGRKLTLWFETIAIHKIVQDSINLLVEEVEEKTGITPLVGTT